MLVATGEGYEPRTIKLESNVLVLGRFPRTSADIDRSARLIRLSLKDGGSAISLSRDHCRLEKTIEGWKVLDTASVNGVFVNGLRVPRLSSIPISNGGLLKLGKSPTPSFEYRLDLNSNDDTNTFDDTNSLLKKELLTILTCFVCSHTIVHAACLPCGHVFCRTCLKNPLCPSCQTQASSKSRGFASRCHPLDRILMKLAGQPASPEKNGHNDVFISLTEGEEEPEVSSKKLKPTVEMDGRCEYCAEPAHEDGMRCPYKDSPAEDESDLEDIV